MTVQQESDLLAAMRLRNLSSSCTKGVLSFKRTKYSITHKDKYVNDFVEINRILFEENRRPVIFFVSLQEQNGLKMRLQDKLLLYIRANNYY